MTDTAFNGAVREVAAVRRFRKRPLVIEGVPWTGGNHADVRAFAAGPDGLACCRWRDPGNCLELWNDQEQAWLQCPPGHLVARGALGEFYPVSPVALEATFDPEEAGLATAGSEHLANSLLLEQAPEALAFERERADTAERELAALADGFGEALRSAAGERERRELAEAEAARLRALLGTGMTPGAASAFLQVSLPRLRYLEKTGKLTATRTGGGHRRYSEEAVRALRDARGDGKGRA